jgi:hypothetical protein
MKHTFEARIELEYKIICESDENKHAIITTTISDFVKFLESQQGRAYRMNNTDIEITNFKIYNFEGGLL